MGIFICGILLMVLSCRYSHYDQWAFHTKNFIQKFTLGLNVKAAVIHPRDSTKVYIAHKETHEGGVSVSSVTLSDNGCDKDKLFEAGYANDASHTC